MNNDDRIRIIAMIANDAALYAIADAMEDCVHPWLDMVKGFMEGKPYRELWTVSMEEFERSRIKIAEYRCRFPSNPDGHSNPGYYGVCEARQRPTDVERKTIGICWQYTESDLRQWAKDEWESIRPGRYFRVHVDERGLLVADEDIPKGATLAYRPLYMTPPMPKEDARG